MNDNLQTPQNQGHDLEKVNYSSKPANGFAQHQTTPRTEKEVNAERRLLLKTDFLILPILSLTLFLGSLDRGDIGYAYIVGMGSELNMGPQQLSAATSMFYIGYIVVEPLATLFLKKITARFQLTGALLAWGTFTALLCLAHTWQQIAGIRFLIGCGEAFIQAASLYLTFFYTRNQLATRGSIYYAMFAIAGSANGLLSYGILQNLNGVHGWLAWRWIYFIEGMLSVGFAFIVLIALPSSPEKLGWGFSEAEKEIALRRYREAFNIENDTKIRPKQILAALKDPKAWFYTAIFCTTNFSLATFSNFLPIMVRGFGFSEVDTNLLTVPVWVFTAICVVVTGVVSDRREQRGYLLMISMALAICGYIILLARPSRWLQFVGTLFVGGGTFPQVVIIQSWMNSNIIGYTKRATVLAMILMLGQLFSIAGSLNYSDPPAYYRGNGFTLAMIALGLVLTAVMMKYLAQKNARKAQNQGSEEAAAMRVLGIEQIQDDHPDFMYYL